MSMSLCLYTLDSTALCEIQMYLADTSVESFHAHVALS